MFDFYINSSVYIQVLLAGLLTWGLTALGASLVFFFKKVNTTVLDAMLGLSAGVMISASFFSLLNPAIDQSETLGMCSWFVVASGFLCGGIFLILSDILFHNLLNKKEVKNASSKKRSLMLMFSITLHNIPEGLAVGVSFGSLALNVPGVTLIASTMLAVGVAIQNLPEGSAISLPLRREGNSLKKSFTFGMLSGIVEPISAFLGCILVLYVQNILPFLLSFAAGAMIFVAISELIPESQKNNHKNIMSLFTILGFTIMMILDVALS